MNEQNEQVNRINKVLIPPMEEIRNEDAWLTSLRLEPRYSAIPRSRSRACSCGLLN